MRYAQLAKFKEIGKGTEIFETKTVTIAGLGNIAQQLL